MAYIQHLGGNRWRVYVSAGWDPARKRYRRVSRVVRAERKKQVEEMAAELVLAVGRGEVARQARITLAEFLDLWDKRYVSALKGRTPETYRQVIKGHLIPGLGSIQLSKLSAMQIQSYFTEKRKSPLAANTIYGQYRVLHCALECAVAWSYLPRNPCDRVRAPKKRRVLKRVPNTKQLALFLRAAERYREYPLFLLAVSSGLRMSELLGLRWSDVDLDGETVMVRQTVQRGGRKPVFDVPKTDAGTRVVTLPQSAVDLLRWHKERQEAEVPARGQDYVDHDLVFPTANGTPILRSNLRRTFLSALKRAGLKGLFTFRELRHTHVSLLVLRGGVTTEALAPRLGHSSPQVTREVYTWMPDGAQQEIAKVTNDLLGEVLDKRVH